jgi:NAD(P)-dependent dehydrogenase (short-subunit alcohol dehydrogenase family)
VKDFLGKADALINAAGVLLPGDWANPLHVCDISELRETFEVNTIGPIMVVKYFSPLIDQGGKVFIMTSEGVGVKNTDHGIPCYALSKSAATKAVGILNASFNTLDFYAVYPGPMHTAITDREKPVAGIDPAEVAEGFYKMVSGVIPLSRDTWYITYKGEALEA